MVIAVKTTRPMQNFSMLYKNMIYKYYSISGQGKKK